LARGNRRASLTRRAGFAAFLAGGGFAALSAGILMAWLRSTLHIRTLPERLLEWALVVAPPGLL